MTSKIPSNSVTDLGEGGVNTCECGTLQEFPAGQSTTSSSFSLPPLSLPPHLRLPAGRLRILGVVVLAFLTGAGLSIPAGLGLPLSPEAERLPQLPWRRGEPGRAYSEWGEMLLRRSGNGGEAFTPASSRVGGLLSPRDNPGGRGASQPRAATLSRIPFLFVPPPPPPAPPPPPPFAAILAPPFPLRDLFAADWLSVGEAGAKHAGKAKRRPIGSRARARGAAWEVEFPGGRVAMATGGIGRET